MKLYYIISGIKAVLGLFILIILYNYINVYQDPVVGIALWFLWSFIFFWWISFFVFLWIQKLFRQQAEDRIIKDSYKLSLLFGIFALLNIGLILLEKRSKVLWLVLLVLFIALHIMLLSENRDE